MLSDLPDTELENLCNILHKEWPQSIQAINFLRTCSEWKKKKPSLDVQILYNKRNIRSGIFILMYKSGCNVPRWTMYALDSYENELEEMVSFYLDHCENIVELSAISKHIPIVEKVINANATYKIISRENCYVFSMEMDKAKNLQIDYPVHVEAKPLEKEHLKDIFEMSSQPVKYIFNLEEFENRLDLDYEFALGIFCKKTGRLLSRCMRCHDGTISSVQTIEEARKKGYATLALQLMSKKLATLSYEPYLFTETDNENSIKAAQAAGFRRVSDLMLAVVEKSGAPTYSRCVDPKQRTNFSVPHDGLAFMNGWKKGLDLLLPKIFRFNKIVRSCRLRIK